MWKGVLLYLAAFFLLIHLIDRLAAHEPAGDERRED